MKQLIILTAVALIALSCQKEDNIPNMEIEGYWNILGDKTFTSNASNATSDLYHLFRDDHAFYRFSFLKTHDFSVLTAKPRADSLIGYYQVEGNLLMIPNPAPSFANIVPGNQLISRSDNEIVFTRYIVERRSALDGSIQQDRTDTIRYLRVTDQAKVRYFDNLLKIYHP